MKFRVDVIKTDKAGNEISRTTAGVYETDFEAILKMGEEETKLGGSSEYGRVDIIPIEEESDQMHAMEMNTCHENHPAEEKNEEKKMIDNKEFRLRLANEAAIERHPIEFDMDISVEKGVTKELKKLKKGMDEEAYQAWKEEYLASEYERTKDYNWVTVHYLFAGIGSYTQTVPDSQKGGVLAFVNGSGSGFLGDIEPATEEEIKNTLAMFADRGIEAPEFRDCYEPVSMRAEASEGGIACGPIDGDTVTEIMFQDDDGKFFFVSVSRLVEFYNAYVSPVSLYDLLLQITRPGTNQKECMATIEKYASEKYHGEIGDYEEMEESDFIPELTLAMYMNDYYCNCIDERIEPENMLESFECDELDVELPQREGWFGYDGE